MMGKRPDVDNYAKQVGYLINIDHWQGMDKYGKNTTTIVSYDRAPADFRDSKRLVHLMNN